MKILTGLISSAMLVLLVATSMGQGPVITSFQGNGQLSWTNAVNSNAHYRVEWAAQADGPWNQTFQNIHTLDGHNATGFSVAVPMFYRVVMATNQPPVGMVWIDGGDVELGDARTNENFFVGTAPVHKNFVSGFWMDATEVTKAQWDDVAAWAATNGYDITVGDGSGKTNNHPVHSVNWYECVKWCNARSQKEGLTPCYFIDPIFFNPYKTGKVNISNAWVSWNSGGYRLPTEAEWEKAARGGRQKKLFPWGGDTIQHTRANYYAATSLYDYDTSLTQGDHPNYDTGAEPYTSAVGSFPANGYGLHDMAGNVSEWCWDWYGGYVVRYTTDPRGPASGTERVIRGGSWFHLASFARVANRGSTDPDFDIHFYGFRCARGL
jgi:formylglycine-generating enzyme required for sulfatase activity